MNTKEIIESIEIIQKLKTGNYNVLSQDEKYNLSVEKLQDDKILKFFARNLKNGEALSGDFYKVRGEYIFRPCEISVERAHDFLSDIKTINS